MLPYIVIGLTSGAVYALAGLGLVLTYKTSAVFNFAHGALATIAAFVFYALYVLNNWSWVTAAIVAILIAGPMMGLMLEVFARRIQTTSLALRVASTVGLLLVIEAAIQLIYGTTIIAHGADLPGNRERAAVRHERADRSDRDVLLRRRDNRAAHGVLPLFAVGRGDARGRRQPGAARHGGHVPVAHAAVSVGDRGDAGGGVGVLFAPVLSLDPVQLTLLVVSAYGAAAIGAFTNIPLTLAGGLGIGVFASLCTKWFTSGLLSGLPPAVPFVVLFVVLLVFPKKYLVGRTFMSRRSGPAWRAPASLQLTGAVVLVGFLCFVPGFAGIHLTDWTTFVALSIVFMSLSLLVRTSGQVSLAHVSFTAIGACAFSHFTGWGIPWFIALILCGLVAVPVGALLEIPAIRLTGLYLALATFGFGICAAEHVLHREVHVRLQRDRARGCRGRASATGDKAYFFLVLILAVACSVCL